MVTMAEFDPREIEEFLYHEAALLDGRKYDEWLALFTENSYYWMPAGRDDMDPQKETSFIYDHRSALGERVARLLHPAAHCQTPPSQTRHLVTNVRIEELSDGNVKVYSSFALFESRLGNQRVFGGHCEHRLRRESGSWRIASKKVCLVNNDGVFSNLTCIF